MLVILFFFISIFSFGQNRLFVFEKKNNLPLKDFVIALSKNNSSSSINYKTNSKGYIEYVDEFTDSIFIKIENLNFESEINFIKKKKIDTIFLKEKLNLIDEVLVFNQEKQSVKRVLVGLLMNYKINLNHNDKLAQLIVKKKKEKKIQKIKLKIVDGFGVKNLKFLPFKVSIYNKDSLTLKPKKCLFTSDIITKKDNKKWVKVDISNLNFFSNEEDLFIVFEILKEYEYKQDLVNSKIGLIPAVPQLKSKIYNPKSSKKCYFFKYFPNNKFIEWEFIKCHLFVDFEYK